MNNFSDAPLMDLLAGRNRMQAGMDQVLTNAGQPWVDQACQYIQERHGGETILAETWRMTCLEVGIKPHHHNGWGALTTALRKRGIIQATDLPYKASRCRTSNAHKSPQWRVIPKSQPTNASN